MTVSVRKALTWLAIALVVLYLVNFPVQAALLVRSGAEALVRAGSALVAFATSLF